MTSGERGVNGYSSTVLSVQEGGDGPQISGGRGEGGWVKDKTAKHIHLSLKTLVLETGSNKQ